MKVNILTPRNPDFPTKLLNIAKPPKQLYAIGEWPLLSPLVAIVGARKATPYGTEVARRLATDLAGYGVTVVSGLALGVDAAAHRGALTSGRTVAVVPGSIQEVQPASHRGLAREILRNRGSIISEYPDNERIRPQSFIERNRLISGLSDAVVVIEAAQRSGSLSTAQFALEQGKPVLAVPGNITSPLSQGTNRLLATGARPALTVEDILEEIGFQPARAVQPPRADTKEQSQLLKLIGAGQSNPDLLSARSGLAPAALTHELTTLELNGHIKNIPGIGWVLTKIG